jgi:hypothetical protein
MPSFCPTCQQILKRTAEGLLKCSICGFTYKPKTSTPLLSGYTPKTLAAKQPNSTDRELEIFINRVAQKLLPIYNDYDIKVKNALMKNRAKLVKELHNVFEGKESLEKWFTRTRRNYGKHVIDMTKILYDSLEGLRSQEAVQMRKEYEQALSAIQQQYNPTAGVGAPPA